MIGLTITLVKTLEVLIQDYRLQLSNSGVTFTQELELQKDDELVGVFVEYNKEDFKETIISESFHKFTIDYSIFNHGQVDPQFGFN